MYQFFSRRSLLPILAPSFALALGLGLSRPALALDTLRLDPSRTGCVLVSLTGGAKRCDVKYDELQVHQGRETGESEANGDFVKCQATIDRAKSLGRSIVMLRGYVGSEQADWDNDDFFTVEGEQPDQPQPQQRLSLR